MERGASGDSHWGFGLGTLELVLARRRWDLNARKYSARKKNDASVGRIRMHTARTGDAHLRDSSVGMLTSSHSHRALRQVYRLSICLLILWLLNDLLLLFYETWMRDQYTSEGWS